MFTLKGPADTFTCQMEEVVTTTNPSFSATYADIDSTDLKVTEDVNSATSVLNGVTAVNLVPIPAGADERDLKYIHVHNQDTVPHFLQFKHNGFPVYRCLLQPNWSVKYGSDSSWHVYDDEGNPPGSAGTLASGSVGRFELASGAVNSGHMASGTVQGFFGSTRHIASGTVGVFDFGSGAVIAGTVGSGAITSGNIASGQVGLNHLASGSVRSGHIASGQVGQFKLASGAVNSGHINTTETPDGTKFLRDDFSWRSLAVSLGSGDVGSGDVASGVVNGFYGPTRNITSGTVGGFDLASGAVEAGTIGSGAVRSGNIASGQVVKTLTVVAPFTQNQTVDDILLAFTGINAGMINSGAVVSGNIASGQIGTGHLADGAVTSGDIGSGQVGWPHLASGSVLSGHIASGQVGQFHIASGSITSGRLGVTETPDGSKFLRDDFTWRSLAVSIGSGDVGSGDVASGVVNGFYGPTRNITSGTVGGFDLASGAVEAGTIGSGAVRSGNIASGQIGVNHTMSGVIFGVPWTMLSGQVGSGVVASGSVGGFYGDTRHVQSGTVGSFDLASGAVEAGAVGSGAVRSGNIASGQVSTNHLASGAYITYARGVAEDTFYTAFGTLSGGRAVSLTTSGNLVHANPRSGLTMPAFGVIPTSVASGQPIQVITFGKMINADFNFSGFTGSQVLWVMSGSRVGRTQPTASGNRQQRMGYAFSQSGAHISPDTIVVTV